MGDDKRHSLCSVRNKNPGMSVIWYMGAGYRKIIHIDMDAFFASVEQRDNPSLRGMPIAVAHDVPRGVVATASYEARKYGIRSAQPVARARKLFPGIVFVAPRFEVYKEVSRQIHIIFRRYTDLIEPISLDEAFLDVTFNKPGIVYAVDIAREIKASIHAELNLTASAGISYNKFLAKIASDYRKPDGLCTIHPARAEAFISRLPVEDFWGVGKVTAARMHALGITDGESLRKVPLPVLVREFGKAGRTFYDFARGVDNRPVEPVHIRKTISCETTFEKDITDRTELLTIIGNLADDLENRIARKAFRGRTFTLKVRYADFSRHTRSYTADHDLTDAHEYVKLAENLLDSALIAGQPLRLLGMGVSDNSIRQRPSENPLQRTLDFGDI